MTRLDGEKKSPLPWIIGLIVLALLAAGIYYFMTANKGANQATVTSNGVELQNAAPGGLGVDNSTDLNATGSTTDTNMLDTNSAMMNGADTNSAMMNGADTNSANSMMLNSNSATTNSAMDNSAMMNGTDTNALDNSAAMSNSSTMLGNSATP